jgi:signal transduction histidine kinase
MWRLLKILYRILIRLLRPLGIGALLVPVAMLSMLLFGVNVWTVAALACAVVVAVRWPAAAGTLLPVVMVILGISGLVIAATARDAAVSWVVAAPAFVAFMPGPWGRVNLKVAVGKVVKKVVAGQHVHGVVVSRPARPVQVFVKPPPGGGAVEVRPGAGPAWHVPPKILFGPGHPALSTSLPQGKVPSYVTPHSVAFSGAGPWSGDWTGRLVLPVALLLLTLGLWLAPRTLAGLRGHVAGLLPWLRRRMLENRWGILLIPVAVTGLTVFGAHLWTVAAVVAAPIVVMCWPAVAADLVPVMLAAFAVKGFQIAAHWQSLPIPARLPAQLYGAILVDSRPLALLAGAEASAFLAVAAWLVPRTIGAHARGMLAPRPDSELAGRVRRLTETREQAVDAATTELRRIERDLHDGAQARLVALGMNLRAVERMLPARPEAALALVAEARETSLRALNDLRNLIRGIYPPVLADRGLGHAVRALALDTPLPVELDIDLPGRPTAPVESACYFAIAEALANAVKHSGGRRVHIRIQHDAGLLRIEVADDGAGGADPDRGTGLRGVERRLGTFDGILAVSSPAGGPTMIVMEVPCALSSPKTFSC